jgi:hypothetical protein
MKYSRRPLFSTAFLVLLILTMAATGALAQPSDEPQDTHTVEFRNDCVDLESCPDTLIPIREIGDGDAGENFSQTATITIAKNAEPADGTDFPFASDLGHFTLDDAVPDDGDGVWPDITFQEVPAGVNLAFVEQQLLAWELTSIACGYSGDSIISAIWDDGNLVGVTINPAVDDEITCTFGNQQVPSSTIIIAKNAEPAIGTDFAFTSDLADFTLDDAVPDDGDVVLDRVTFSPVPASADYAFVEQPPLFWALDSIVCVYSGDSIISGIWDGESLVGVSINPATDDEITCTFFNVQVAPYRVHLPIVSKNYAWP